MLELEKWGIGSPFIQLKNINSRWKMTKWKEKSKFVSCDWYNGIDSVCIRVFLNPAKWYIWTRKWYVKHVSVGTILTGLTLVSLCVTHHVYCYGCDDKYLCLACSPSSESYLADPAIVSAVSRAENGGYNVCCMDGFLIPNQVPPGPQILNSQLEKPWTSWLQLFPACWFN